MVNLFTKKRFIALLALVSIQSMQGLMAFDCCEPVCYDAVCCEPVKDSRVYIGGFGGELFSNSSKLTQIGTAFFTEAQGGPLAVLATGRSNKTTSGFGGIQLGYEKDIRVGCSDWSFAPAGEIEAFFYSHSKRGDLINPTARLPEHDFVNSFKLNTSVILVNGVLSLKSERLWGFTPYVGGGLGAARISLKNAKSIQIAPPEAGINHYNSKTDDSTWAFAAQAKAGLSYKICNSLHVFAEYRYVFIDTSNYVLGSTDYPGSHAVTSAWNVNVKNTQYNAFTIGIQYDL